MIMRTHYPLLIGILAIFTLFTSTSAHAQATWDGEVGGNWSTGGNWLLNTVPSAGDSLTFGEPVNLVTTNDISDGFLVGGMTFTNGYPGEDFTLDGLGITLNGNIDCILNNAAAQGTNVVLENVINLDIDVSGDRNIYARQNTPVAGSNEYHQIRINGSITGDRLTKEGEGMVTLAGPNSNAGFDIKNGILAIAHDDALGPTNRLNGGTAELQINDGVTVDAPLTVGNAGGNKVLKGELGTNNVAEYAGTITLEETDVWNFDLRPNSNTGDFFNTNQVLRISGLITGGAFSPSQYPIEIKGRATVELTNPSNDFAGGINLQDRGATLRVAADGVLSSGNVRMNNRDTSVILANGVNVTNTLVAWTNGSDKRLRLESGDSNTAEWSGPVDVVEPDIGHFEFHAGTAGVNNNPAQVLTISGPITSTNGAAFDVYGDGVVVVDNPANQISHNIRIVNNGSTLRLLRDESLGTRTNTVSLDQNGTWLELADGMTLGTSTVVRIVNEGGTHGIRVYDAQPGVAETATVACAIVTYEDNTLQGRLQATDPMDTLIVTGVISEGGTSNKFSAAGDGTVIFDGSVANEVTGQFSVGDGGSSTWDGTSGNKNGFVIVRHAGAFGDAVLLGRGSQLTAGMAGMVITNRIELSNNGLFLGGTNDLTLTGNIKWNGTANFRQIAHLGLEGVTYTLNGDVAILDGKMLEILGSDNKDNGTFVLNGSVSGNGGTLDIDHRFDGGDIYLNGTNTYTGRITFRVGTLHIYQEANLGGNPAAWDADALWMADSTDATLHLTDSFAIDDANRGIQIGGNGDAIFDVDATKTVTLGSSNVIYSTGGAGRLVKQGDGTLVLQAANTFSNDTEITAGTLAVASGSALPDGYDVVIGETAGAALRLDASETIASLTSAGTVALNGNTLTLPAGSVNRVDGNVTGGGVLAIGDGATLRGEADGPGSAIALGTISGLVWRIDGATTNALSAGTLDLSAGTQTVVLAVAPTNAAETITVASYGTLNGGLGNLLLENAANYRTAVLATNGSAITLNVGNQIHGWDNGSGNRQWDIGTSSNWTSAAETYYDADTIGFGDVGDGTVTVMTAVAPGYVTFTNTAGSDYVVVGGSGAETIACGGGIHVTGSGDVTISDNVVVGGGGGVEHAGSGTLTLGGTNTFTGGVIVRAGSTLCSGGGDEDAGAGQTMTLGSDSQSSVMIIESGATFDVNGDHDFKRYLPGSITVSGTGVGGLGAIVNNGPVDSDKSFADEINLAGDVTFGGSKRFDIDGTMRTSASGVTITKIGANRVEFSGDNRTASISNVIVNAGSIRVTNNNGFGPATVTINSGAFVDFWNNKTIANAFVFNGGRISHGRNGYWVRLNGPINVIADSRIDPNNNSRTIYIAGTLTGTNRLDIGNGTNDLTGDISGFTGLMNLDEAGTVLGMDGTDNTVMSIAAVAGSVIENDNVTTGSITLGGDNTDTALPSVFRDGAAGGALSVVKVGTGTLTLNGVNTYTGTTSVEAGTLLLTADSTNMTGTVTVQSGALFGGAGSVGGAVVFEDGAGLSVELNDADVTLDCATLTLNELDISECDITVDSGHMIASEYVLIQAASPVTGSVVDGKVGITGGSVGVLAVEGNQLLLRTIPASTVFVVR